MKRRITILTDVLPDQRQYMSDVSRRRRLGVYYTPDDLATVLVKWALANGAGPVLDPSYGGCAFLEAAVRTLSESGHARPGTRVYGVDIDPSCVDTVRRSKRLIEANCIEGDFLSASPHGLNRQSLRCHSRQSSLRPAPLDQRRSMGVCSSRGRELDHSTTRDRQPLGLFPPAFSEIPFP